MLSICLQSMVDELMVKKSGGSIRKVRAWGLGLGAAAGLHQPQEIWLPGATPWLMGRDLDQVGMDTWGSHSRNPLCREGAPFPAEPFPPSPDVPTPSEWGAAALRQPAGREVTPTAGECCLTLACPCPPVPTPT